ncbi:MAG: hypothetical protein Q9162_002848 [Coniocarpon cinnabarinum]
MSNTNEGKKMSDKDKADLSNTLNAGRSSQEKRKENKIKKAVEKGEEKLFGKKDQDKGGNGGGGTTKT